MRKIALLLLVLGTAGCGALQFPTINAPKPPEQVYKYSQTIEKQPQVVQTPDGKSYVWESQKQTVDVNYEKKEKPLSWWQRFCNWLGNLGIIGILLLVGALVIAPGGTMMFLWKKYQQFRKAFTQTVKAIDDAKAVETNPALKQSLSARQDNSVKALVDDIQQPGK